MMRPALLTLCCLALLSGPARADQWILPAGSNPRIEAFVEPMRHGVRVADDFELVSIRTQSDHLDLVFKQHSSGAEHVLQVSHRDRPDSGPLVGSVRLSAVGSVPAPLVAAVESMLRSNTVELPWRRITGVPGGTAATDRAPAQSRFPTRALLLVVLAVLALATVMSMFRARRPRSAALAGLAIVSIGGMAIRAIWSPWTFLHEYYHVGDHIEQYLFRTSDWFLYGETGPAIYRLANAIFGGDEQAIFRSNLLMASLTVPAVALLDLGLFKDWRRATVAGAIFACLPVHIYFSAAEDLSIPATLFAVWSLAFFVRWLESRDVWHLVGTICGLALAMQARPEVMLLPLAMIAFVVLTRPRDLKLLVEPRSLVAALVLVLLLLPRLLQLKGATTNAPDALPSTAQATQLFVFFDRTVTPIVLWPFAVVGLAWGLWKRPGAHVWLVLWVAGFALFSMSFFRTGAPYNLRTQIITTPMLAILCASASSALSLALARWPRVAAAASLAVIAAVALSLPLYRSLFERQTDQQQEWEFLRDETAKLPPGRGRLIALVRPDHRKLGAFPQFLLDRNDRPLELLDLDEVVRTGPWPDPYEAPLYFYEGVNCFFSHADEAKPDPVNARCQAIRRHYELAPIATRLITAPGFPNLVYAKTPYEIGYYRAKAIRVPNAPPPD